MKKKSKCILDDKGICKEEDHKWLLFDYELSQKGIEVEREECLKCGLKRTTFPLMSEEFNNILSEE